MKRTNKYLLIRLAFCTALLLCSALLVAAQSTKPDEDPKVEFFVGYSALGETGSRVISLGPNAGVVGDFEGQGFETSIIRNFSKRFGIKGDFSAHFNNESSRGPVSACSPVCTTVTQDFSSRPAFTIFWLARSLRRATARALRPSCMRSAGLRTPVQLSRPQVQHTFFLLEGTTTALRWD